MKSFCSLIICLLSSVSFAQTFTMLKNLDGTLTATSTYFSEIIAVNGICLYTARTTGGCFELWKSDGTVTGTEMIKNVCAANITNVSGKVFFITDNGSGSGTELWKTDGSNAGTEMIKDIFPGPAGSNPDDLINVNGIAYFSAETLNGRELWKSDGTAAGTTLLKDINPGPGGSNPANFANMNGVLYFSAETSAGRELWKSDGTA